MFDKMHNLLLLLILMCNYIFQTFSYNGLRFQVFRSNGTVNSIEYIQNDEDLKYPTTQKDIQKIKNMWHDYYACLQRKNNEKSRPEIRRLVRGQFTEFKCDMCHKPFQNYDDIEWKYKPTFPSMNLSSFETLDLTPEMTLTKEKHLKMYNVPEHFSGLYVCYHNRYPVSAYVLEVSINDPIQEINGSYANSNKRYNLQIPNLQIYRMWSEWTECSSCEIVGRRFKYGICMLRKETGQDQNEILFKGLSVTQGSILIIHYTEPNQKTGIPCMSPILPEFISGSIDKDKKAVQAVVQFCLVPCQEIEIFIVRESSGKVIETANNSAGIYSLYQKIPQLPPEIERRTVVAGFGKDIIIQCPGTTLKNIPFTWKINKQIIFPALIANESNGRFTIDPIQRIHLKKLRLKDNHIYSCWQRDRLVGTVHLYVEKKFTVTLDHHVILCLAVIIVGVFVFMGTKLCKRQFEINE